VAEYAVMASMSGTFRSGVKFSTAKPNSTVMAGLQRRWAGAVVRAAGDARSVLHGWYARVGGHFIGEC
jgi:hypothetical protein